MIQFLLPEIEQTDTGIVHVRTCMSHVHTPLTVCWIHMTSLNGAGLKDVVVFVCIIMFIM